MARKKGSVPLDFRLILSSAVDQILQILYEDHQWLVVNKPAGLVCHPTKGDEFSSLISRLRLYLGPGLQPQLINRLDRETSGVVITTKTLEAARPLRRLWESRLVQKEYLAIVHGWPLETSTLIDAPLGSDPDSPVAIKSKVRPDGSPAQTEIEVLERFNHGEASFALLRALPRTGRKHQIRVHLAHWGHPLVGDKLYGPDESLYLDFVFKRLQPDQKKKLLLPCHALHASRLLFCLDENRFSFEAPPETWFNEFVETGQCPAW